MRKTKIICTIGPASRDRETIRRMIEAGMNVARLNFSHGTREEHAKTAAEIRDVAKELGAIVGILQDLTGPDFRIGKIPGDEMDLRSGEDIWLVQGETGDPSSIPISYPSLLDHIVPGNAVLLGDGEMELEVVSKEEKGIRCRVIRGGKLRSGKGLNVPGLRMDMPSLTAKDLDDLEVGIAEGFDFVAISMVRRPEDVEVLRSILMARGRKAKVVAKIEHPDALKNIDRIISAADAVMVARGDLGLEMPLEEVPVAQKRIIRKCNEMGKPVITATQMLESMVGSRMPTRAEASDVANAVLDGTDALMLSEETAIGRYPVEATEFMARIAEAVESSMEGPRRDASYMRCGSITDAIGHAAAYIAEGLGAAAIITPTTSGSTPMLVSKYRPSCPIIAPCSDPLVASQLTMVWGVFPVISQKAKDTDEMIDMSIRLSLEKGFIKKGDLVVITAGQPVGIPGTTNLIKVHVV
jgi:pyruvate kinase